MKTMRKVQLDSIPKLTQTQAPLNDQLMDLVVVAQRLGMYDAADYLKDKLSIR